MNSLVACASDTRSELCGERTSRRNDYDLAEAGRYGLARLIARVRPR